MRAGGDHVSVLLLGECDQLGRRLTVQRHELDLHIARYVETTCHRLETTEDIGDSRLAPRAGIALRDHDPRCRVTEIQRAAPAEHFQSRASGILAGGCEVDRDDRAPWNFNRAARYSEDWDRGGPDDAQRGFAMQEPREHTVRPEAENDE